MQMRKGKTAKGDGKTSRNDEEKGGLKQARLHYIAAVVSFMFSGCVRVAVKGHRVSFSITNRELRWMRCNSRN